MSGDVKPTSSAEPAWTHTAPEETGDAPSRRPRPRTPRPWRRWVLRLALVGVVLLLGLLAAAWMAMGQLIEYGVREQLPALEAKLGRDISFDAFEMQSPSHLVLHEVTVFEPDSDATFMTVDAIHITLSHHVLWDYDEVHIVEVKLEGPHLTVRRDAQGRHNVDDLVDRFQALITANSKTTPSRAETLLRQLLTPLPMLRLEGATINVEDAQPDVRLTPHRVKDAHFTLARDPNDRTWSLLGQGVLEYSTATTTHVEQPVHVDLRGRDLASLQADVDFGADGWAVPVVDTILGRVVRINRVVLTASKTLQLHSLEVGGPGPDTPPLVSTSRLDLPIDPWPPTSLQALVPQTLTLEGLTFNLTIREDGRLGLMSMLRQVRKEMSSRRQPRSVQHQTLQLAEHAAEPVGEGLLGALTALPFARVSLADITMRLDDQRRGQRQILTFDNMTLEWERSDEHIKLGVEADINGATHGHINAVVDYWPKVQQVRLSTWLEDVRLVELRPLISMVHWPSTRWQQRLPLEEIKVSAGVDGTPLAITADLSTRDLDIKGPLRVSGLALKHPKLSPFPLDGIDLGGLFDVRYRHTAATLDVVQGALQHNGAQMNVSLHLGQIQLLGDARGLGPEAPFDMALEWPLQPAQVVFEGIPFGLRHVLEGMTFTGDVGLKITARGRMDEVDETDLGVTVSMDAFGVTNWPEEIDLTRLNRGMPRMRVRDPNALQPHTIQIPPSSHAQEPLGRRSSRRMGLFDGGGFEPTVTPSEIRRVYPHWVPFEDIPVFMIQMITTTEDGSFFRHQGFSPHQVLNAMAKNLKEGRFVRGASTITMQLVKNVFLGRDKTVARKFQEVLLTWLVESVVRVPKRRLLEVYFNVIEYGPEIYGLRDAAVHYFGKRARDLTLREATFLVSIIPQPRKYHRYWEEGRLSTGWAKVVDRYIRIMYRRKCTPEKLAIYQRRWQRRGEAPPYVRDCPTPEMLDLMLDEPLEFYRPGPDGPTYRPDLYDAYGYPLRSLLDEPDADNAPLEDNVDGGVFEELGSKDLF